MKDTTTERTCIGCGDELDGSPGAEAYGIFPDGVGHTAEELWKALKEWEAEGCPGPFYCRQCMDRLPPPGEERGGGDQR